VKIRKGGKAQNITKANGCSLNAKRLEVIPTIKQHGKPVIFFWQKKNTFGFVRSRLL